jgi:hypothetical protein
MLGGGKEISSVVCTTEDTVYEGQLAVGVFRTSLLGWRLVKKWALV